MFLRLETVLVSGVRDGVDESVRSGVLVTALHLNGLVVLADLLEGSLLLACSSVAGLETGGDCCINLCVV